jgi:hypothetical protein
MVLKVAGVVLVLVIWSGRVLVLPSWRVPKSSAIGETVSGDGVAVPKRLMKSRAVLASEVISRALMRLSGVEVTALGCGVKVMMRMQLEEGRMVEQLLWTVKSGVVWRAVMWMGTVPALARVIVCGCPALPTCVEAKVRELWDAV